MATEGTMQPHENERKERCGEDGDGEARQCRQDQRERYSGSDDRKVVAADVRDEEASESTEKEGGQRGTDPEDRKIRKSLIRPVTKGVITALLTARAIRWVSTSWGQVRRKSRRVRTRSIEGIN